MNTQVPGLSDPTVQRGWRIDRLPAHPPRLAEDGRLAVPLWLVKDGTHVADVPWYLSPSDARALCTTLEDIVASAGTPRTGDTSVTRLPRWVLRPDRAATLHCMVCETCAARSDEEPDPEPSQRWALTHTRHHPRHREYCQQTTSGWSAVTAAPA